MGRTPLPYKYHNHHREDEDEDDDNEKERFETYSTLGTVLRAKSHSVFTKTL